MSDKKKDKEAQEAIRKQLESMLLQGEQISDSELKASPVANEGENNPLNKVQHPETQKMEFYKVKEDIEAESRKLLKSVMDFYLDAKILKKNEYVKYKKAVDEMTLSNIIFSLKTTQHAIIKLMEEIDMGNMHPRIFEVLAQLQGQMMTVVKHQAAYMITLEEGYKKVKEDNDRIEYMRSLDKEKQEPAQLGTGDKMKVRGTKNLMLEIRSRVENAEDAKFEEIPADRPGRLTDPYNRPPNPMDAGKEAEDKFDEENGFDIDDELF